MEKVSHLERNSGKEKKQQPGDLKQSRKTSVETLHAANANTADGGYGYHQLKRAETKNAPEALDHFLLPRTDMNALTA